MSTRPGVLAALLLALAAVLLAPTGAAAQDPIPCTGCPIDGGGLSQAPPTVGISPSAASYSGTEAGYTQAVEITWCSSGTAPMSGHKIFLNDVEVTGQFSLQSVSPDGQDCGTRMVSTGAVLLVPGANTLKASVVNAYGPGSDVVILSYRVTGYGVSVTPDREEVALSWGAPGTQPFTVTNTGSTAATYNLTLTCEPAAGNCAKNLSQVTLAAGASATVTASFVGGGAGMTGALRLRASRADDPSMYDEGSLQVNTPASAGTLGTPVLRHGGGSHAGAPTPSLCLTTPAGPGAYQCGDLRLAHALPTVRTLNRARTPVLVYNSAHAAPMMMAGAEVQLPAGAASPHTVRATLTLASGGTATRDYHGYEWTPGRYRRITLGKLMDGVGATSLFDYNLRVQFIYGSGSSEATLASTMGIVDRAASPFGAGWWLAGLEQISSVGSAIVWTGGDGAQRRYLPTGRTGEWAAPTITHGDTLRQLSSTEIVRLLPSGDTVVFDNLGRHVATADRMGVRTRFEYDGNRRLIQILVPRGTNASLVMVSHTFHYDLQGRLEEVRSYDKGGWAASPPRRTQLRYELGDRRVTAIVDPDGTVVRFGYDAAAPPRIASRTDRRGNVSSWTYDAAGKLAEAATPTAAGQAPARTRWQAAESRGWTRSTGQVSTLLDGPREDVPDIAYITLGFFGMSTEIQDPEGRKTSIAYDAAFPALPRRVATPSGQVTGAVYDARGNVTSVTDSSTFRMEGGAKKYATTRYEYKHPRYFHLPTRIFTPEEKDSTVISYDTFGRREWVQDARGDSTRVSFTYDPATRLVATVRSHATGLPRVVESFAYDSIGNLAATWGPLADTTYLRTDLLGRVVRTVTPRFAHTYEWNDSAYVATTYDVMDRARRTESVGPPMRLPAPYADTLRNLAGPNFTDRERLIVETYYDAEGQADSVARWAVPDSALVGRMTTKWVYDAAGRVVREIAGGDTATEHRAYDEAGNVVGTVTKRGHVLSTRYDVMNRPVRRITPAVAYPRETIQVGDSAWVFPLFEPVEPGAFGGARNTSGLVIPGDTAVFAYDSAGRMVRADNRDARVKRVWNVNGTLQSETQRIRTYRGADSTTHVYTIGYEYDLNGRRTKVQHPANLAPPTGRGYTSYEYHPHGPLFRVLDVLGNTGMAYHWDAEGRLARKQGRTDQFFSYDVGGRLVRRRDMNGAGTLHDDTLTYDQRGKVTAVWARAERAAVVNRYSGLGSLLYSQTRDSLHDGVSLEEYRLDPFANYIARVQTATSTTSISPPTQETERYRYQAGTGRLLERAGAGVSGSAYDRAGNQVAAGSRRMIQVPYDRDVGSNSVFLLTRTRSYFGADDRLRVLDRKACLIYGAEGCAYRNEMPPVSERGAFEEHRYDALGRRVLTRTRQEHICHNAQGIMRDCIQSVVRTVWDGDQMLYEVSAPGASGSPVLEMERDTGHSVPLLYSDNYYGYGRVAYAHGLGIDDPATVVRVEYSDTLPWAVSIQPVSNWAGRYDGGMGLQCVTYGGGSGSGQIAIVVPEPGSEWEVDQPISQPEGGVSQHCMKVDWPATGAWLNLNDKPTQFHARKSWMGSLLAHGQDASGQYYRRNRYYDAGTGRFTQEDPIGLAGGTNLYGYANGDPIMYSDPYGLCAKYQRDSDGNCPGGLTVGEWRSVEAASSLLSRSERRAVRSMLNDGNIRKEAGSNPEVAGHVPLSDPNSIYLNTAFKLGSPFSLPVADLAWLLSHELKHTRQLGGPMGAVGRVMFMLFRTGDHRTDPWEQQAIKAACRQSTTAVWSSWC